jgi:hypothetical protein
MPIGGPAIDHAGHPSGRVAKSVEELDGRLGADNAPSPIDVDPAVPPLPLPPPPSSDVGEMRPAESAAQFEPSFIIIDDDVDVPGRVLNHRRREVSAMTCPPLAQYHRPRSSPQVRQVLGIDANEKQPRESRPVQESRGSIILHITSLIKYKLVLNTVQSTLFLVPPSWIPDIMVIPEPAGPRRFLTALYAAVRRSLVDPYISPIATESGHCFPSARQHNDAFIRAGGTRRISDQEVQRPQQPTDLLNRRSILLAGGLHNKPPHEDAPLLLLVRLARETRKHLSRVLLIRWVASHPLR